MMNLRVSPPTLRRRRANLATALDGSAVLLVGNVEIPLNYPANHRRFRQDSSFLFYLDHREPGAAALIEADGHTTLFLPEPEPGDALWHGEVPGPEESRRNTQADKVAWLSELPAALAGLRARGVAVSTVPVASAEAQALQRQWLGAPASTAETTARAVAATIALRMHRDAEELAMARQAMLATAWAFELAMGVTAPGATDRHVEAAAVAAFSARGCGAAYPPIVTARGEVLHGRSTGAVLEAGQLLLMDAGAEHPGGLATDVTRTWPVSGRFTGRQRAAYEAVLAAQAASIAACRPGIRYRDVHLAAARVLAQAGVDLGLLAGDVDGLVERGAHAVFFPHGVGHLIGLDVHDMELFGDAAGYATGRTRSEQFGLAYLRLDRDLEVGMSVTIEPGFYVVPAILNDAHLRATLGDSVRWNEALAWLPFGGIRVEDDVAITDGEPEVLSAAIPKQVHELEARVGTRLELGRTLSGG